MSLIKLKNNALDNLTSFEGSANLGDMVLVSSATASSSVSIEFDLGSYKEYKFFFVNMHPSVDGAYFTFNTSIDSGSNYNVTKTTTFFDAAHSESDSTSFGYVTSDDLSQSTAFQILGRVIGADNDQNLSGYLQLFNPSSSVYAKHFISRVTDCTTGDFIGDRFIAGYANTASALTNIKFQMSSGNIDDGKILMFGLN